MFARENPDMEEITSAFPGSRFILTILHLQILSRQPFHMRIESFPKSRLRSLTVTRCYAFSCHPKLIFIQNSIRKKLF